MAVFIVLWPYLLTTKLKSVIRNNLGHSNVQCRLSMTSWNIYAFLGNLYLLWHKTIKRYWFPQKVCISLFPWCHWQSTLYYCNWTTISKTKVLPQFSWRCLFYCTWHLFCYSSPIIFDRQTGIGRSLQSLSQLRCWSIILVKISQIRRKKTELFLGWLEKSHKQKRHVGITRNFATINCFC